MNDERLSFYLVLRGKLWYPKDNSRLKFNENQWLEQATGFSPKGVFARGSYV